MAWNEPPELTDEEIKQLKEEEMPEVRKVFTTPKGRSLYPFITIPDTKFDSDGIYRVDLILDPTKEPKHKKFLAELKVQVPNGGHAPYKAHIDKETEKETGLYVVHFTSKYQPKQFDSKGAEITHDKIMANDSIIKVAYVPNVYEKIAGKDGLKLYLQAVQIFEFIEWHGANADYYGFEEEADGYTVEATPFNEDVVEGDPGSDITEGDPLPEGVEKVAGKPAENIEDGLPF